MNTPELEDVVAERVPLPKTRAERRADDAIERRKAGKAAVKFNERKTKKQGRNKRKR